MNIKLAGKVNILIIVGFPGLHAGSQGFFKTQVGRPDNCDAFVACCC